jgi:ACT domain-containing protein
MPPVKTQTSTVGTMKKELVFITVIGCDQKGIVARIATYLSKAEINIEDISQKITEGYFVMTMLVDVSDTKRSIEKVADDLDKVAADLKLKIQVQHQDLFTKMHRV